LGAIELDVFAKTYTMELGCRAPDAILAFPSQKYSKQRQ